MKRLTCRSELARAIREDRKTETRRVINPQPRNHPICAVHGLTVGSDPAQDGNEWLDADGINPGIPMKGPLYLPGEIVGIAEPWRMPAEWDHLSGKEIIANYKPEWIASSQNKIRWVADFTEPEMQLLGGRTRLARFLPDAFVRTRIEIVAVTAERLQEVTEEQAMNEGAKKEFGKNSRTYLAGFMRLWDTIHGKDAPWSSNPWVWRYQFRRAV